MKSKAARILGILISVLVLFASCGQMMNGGESRVSINLPYVNNANSRAVSSDALQRIKGDHASYRVHINDRVLEGAGGNFSAYFPVGTKVDVFIECVNAKGEVILRTVTKSVVVAVGGNDIDFNLKEDGTEIIPESQKGRVIYTYGEAENKPGDKGGLPTDDTVYRPGDTFTVKNGDTMTWTHATAFTGWKTNVALTGDTNASAGNVDAGGDVQLGGTYIMPEGGVVHMAQWQKRTYRIEYNDNASNSGGTQTTSQMPSTENITALENATIPSVDLQPVNANGKNYTFTGYWLTDSNGTDGKRYRAGDTIPMTADITLYAQWSDKNVYTVTYNTGAGPTTASVSGLDSNTVNVIDGNSIKLPMLQATGYTFNGWKVTSGGSGDYDGGANYIPTATVTLTAQWTINSYSVTYSWGDGVTDVAGVLPTQDQVDYGSTFQVIIPASVTRTNYKFLGWSETDGQTSNPTYKTGTTTSATVSGEITLYAVWEATEYTIRYTTNKGNSPGDTIITVKTPNVSVAGANDVGTVAGYEFTGWKCGDNDDMVQSIWTAADFIQRADIYDQITLTAVWEVVYKTDKSTWEVGDVILTTGSDSSASAVAVHQDAYADRDDSTYSTAMAIVYKVEGGKAWAVGTTKKSATWCSSNGVAQTGGPTTTVNGSQDSYTFTGYTDGSEGLELLRQQVTNADDDSLEANYPAWYFACKYGETNDYPGEFASGWYLPSIAELYDLYRANTDNNDIVKNAVTAVGSTNFFSGLWMSSSTNPSQTSSFHAFSQTAGINNGTKTSASGITALAFRQFM